MGKALRDSRSDTNCKFQLGMVINVKERVARSNVVSPVSLVKIVVNITTTVSNRFLKILN